MSRSPHSLAAVQCKRICIEGTSLGSTLAPDQKRRKYEAEGLVSSSLIQAQHSEATKLKYGDDSCLAIGNAPRQVHGAGRHLSTEMPSFTAAADRSQEKPSSAFSGGLAHADVIARQSGCDRQQQGFTEHLHFHLELAKRKTACRCCGGSINAAERRVSVEWVGILPYGERNTTPPRLYMHPHCFDASPYEMVPPLYRAAQARPRAQGYNICSSQLLTLPDLTNPICTFEVCADSEATTTKSNGCANHIR